MRTLKALLCLSAIAGCLATSVAQNVYSLNIVGYVNVQVAGNNALSLISNPLKPSSGNYNITNTIALPDTAEGILALHISNAHLDLEPVVEKLGTTLRKHTTFISNKEDEEKKIYSSDWVLMTSEPLSSPEIVETSEKLKSNSKMRVWTDDYNNLFQILKKKRFWE